MRDKSIHIRVEHDDYEKLVQLAGAMKITPSAVARTLVLAGLSPYDRKHDALLDRLERVEMLMQKVGILAAGALVSAAIPPDLAGEVSGLNDEIMDKMRNHVRQSIEQGKNIDRAYDEGRFDEENGSVPGAEHEPADMD
jgi:hypothetical protein